MLAKVSTTLETLKKCFSHVKKKLKEISLRKKLAYMKAQLKKCQDKEAQKWPHDPEVAQNCQRQKKT